ncbi:MAG: AAA family ATPase, partial [Myxococcota bacterium]
YMAPEQLQGQPVTPAADLYALGAIIYRIASGHHVFEGSSEHVKRDLVDRPAPYLSVMVDGIPQWLDRICLDLLAKDPAQRPTLRDLCRDLLPHLGADMPDLLGERSDELSPLVRGDTDSPTQSAPAMAAAAAPSAPYRGPSAPDRGPGALIGRRDVQDRMAAALRALPDSGFALLALTGPTGAGKTALADWLAEQATASGAAVLRGRCRPRERIPFNAVDGIVDDLAILVAKSRPAAADARPPTTARAIAASAFPVLGAAAADRPTRAAVFDAVTQLIEYVARGRSAILVIDDLQWADEDSLALLDRMVDYLERGLGETPIAIVTTLRDDVGDSAGAAWLDRWSERRHALCRLAVTPLSDAAIAAIIADIAHDRGQSCPPEIAAQLAHACTGRPFLAEVAGRALADGVYSPARAERPGRPAEAG